MKQVVILSTGNELLYGKTIDTNSGFISARLFPMDLRVRMFMVAGDDTGELEWAIRHALEESDIVIMTGGLGPTDDDNAIAALQGIFGFPLRIDERSCERMDAFFRKIGMPMTEKDLKMAEVPAGALVLPNENGLAPGFIVQHNDKILIAMPGVPGEVSDMMDRSIIPFLHNECGIQSKTSMSFRVIGMKESEINSAVKNMNIPIGRMEWGMTAREGITTAVFVGKGGGAIEFNGIIDEAKRVFGECFLNPLWERPEEEVVDILRKKNLTVSFAESCTGGLISKRITDIPGSSDIFTGSVVAYSNSVKVSQLGVSEDNISRFGAVSREVASEMAAGVRSLLESAIGISTTGIAGPGGGTESKPVGMVWFGLADETGVKTFSSQISGGRDRIRTFASLIAMEHLRTYLKHIMFK